MELAIALIGSISVFSAALCIAIGGMGSAFAEGNAAQAAFKAMGEQPDETSTLIRTLFITMATLESTAIYALVITFLILFQNPFWNYVISIASK